MPRIKYPTDGRVDDYINSLPSWQQEVCQQARDLVHAADAVVRETIKRTKLPYFTLDGNICALLGAKDHVNIFIYHPIAPDPEGHHQPGPGQFRGTSDSGIQRRIDQQACSAEPLQGGNRQQPSWRVASVARESVTGLAAQCAMPADRWGHAQPHTHRMRGPLPGRKLHTSLECKPSFCSAKCPRSSRGVPFR
jgi:hypothetical protein